MKAKHGNGNGHGKSLAVERVSQYAVERAEMERAHLMQEAQEAAAAGVSEYMIADWAGVQRSTVRGWLGKR